MRKFKNTLPIIFLMINALVCGQDISEKYPDVIHRIRIINNDNSFKKVTLTNEEFMTHPTDGGGELIGYFKNDEIQKITRMIGLSYGIEALDYYFQGGKLIFVYEVLNGFAYDEKLAKFDYTKTEINFIGRYYFKGGKLIDSETTGHNRFEDDKLDIEKMLNEEMTEHLDKLNKKRRASLR